jgi:hypothetical protein
MRQSLLCENHICRLTKRTNRTFFIRFDTGLSAYLCDVSEQYVSGKVFLCILSANNYIMTIIRQCLFTLFYTDINHE